MLEAFAASTAVVALAEIGDKTMLLAIVLAARLRAPWQILGGILVATLANHALAALVGREVAGLAGSAVVSRGSGAWFHCHGRVDAGARQAGRCRGPSRANAALRS